LRFQRALRRAPRNDSLPARLRHRANRFIHHPVTDMVVIVLIILSVLTLLLEAALRHDEGARELLYQIGDIFTWIFVAELAIRFWVAPKKTRFFMRYWPDLMAVLPLYRPMRLLRVLLLLRLFRAGVLVNRRVTFLRRILQGTLRDLLYVATVTITLVLVGAVTVHLGRGSVVLDQPGLEGSLWFSVYTLIGGEPIGGLPQNDLGRAVTLGLMLGGLTVFGMAVGTVSATMALALSRRMEANEMELDELSDHMIICGWNRAGPTLLQETFGRERRLDQAIVVVTEQKELTPDLYPEGIPRELIYHVHGDYTRVDVLESVAIRRAAVAVLLTDTQSPRSDQDRDARTVLAALTIERLNKDIFCCAELTDRQNEELLRMAGVEEIVVGDWYAGVVLANAGRNLGMVMVLDDILTATRGNSFYKVRVPRRYSGQTIAQLHASLKAESGAILVSWERGAGAEREFVVNPPVDLVIRQDDVLVVIARQPVKL
jgi:voltage-gated potassium channel